MMSVSRRGLLSIAGAAGALAVLEACSAPPAGGGATGTSAAASGAGTDPADPTAALAAVAATAFAQSGLAGCAMRVRHDGVFWRGTFGTGDLAAQTPYPSSGFVRIASITKTFTATAVLRMIDDGLLDFDTPLAKFYPQIANASSITLEQMLGMRSGIYDFTGDDRFTAAFDADPDMPWSIDDTVAVIRRNDPLFAPGAEVAYCDSNYALLGAIAAQVDGGTVAEVIQNRVITPAKLLDTSYPTDATIPSPHPNGYVPAVRADNTFDSRTPPKLVNEVNPAVAAGAGALISTLEDLSAWGDELVDGTLLGPVTQARRLQTHRFKGQTLDFGYGLGITNFNKYLGHDGAIFGFSSVILTRPDTRTQIAIVSNESTNFTTPTLNIAVAIINEIDPSQGTAAR